MSLRATILAAIAYVLVLVIVVLEVPLVVNLSRRVGPSSSRPRRAMRWARARGASSRWSIAPRASSAAG
jgi:hypothetical protein